MGFFDSMADWYDRVNDEFNHGMTQVWYNLTGQQHLTDKYQYELDLKKKQHQIETEDLKAAGLSPYASLSGTSFGQPSSGQLQGLEKASAIRSLMQQKANYSSTMMDNAAKEANLKAAQELGLSPEEYSYWAKYVGLGKGILNFLNDVVDGNNNSLISAFLGLFDGASKSTQIPETLFPFNPIPSTTSKFISKHSDKYYVTKEGKKEFDNPGSSLYRYPWK